MKQTAKISNVVQLIGLLYRGALRATGWSWRRLNGCLYSTLQNAIVAGMEFQLDDFATVYSSYQGGYWFGENGIENFFAVAVDVANLSACKSIEDWRKRPAFMFEGKRVYVGRAFDWAGFSVVCTSITPEYLVACAYRRIEKSYGHIAARGDGAPTKILKITQHDLKEQRRIAREAAKAKTAGASS